MSMYKQFYGLFLLDVYMCIQEGGDVKYILLFFFQSNKTKHGLFATDILIF